MRGGALNIFGMVNCGELIWPDLLQPYASNLQQNKYMYII